MTPEARAQLVDIAEEIISDMVLNEPLIPFHREDLRHYFSRNWTKRVTGTESIPDAVQLSLAQEAATRMSSRFPSAQIVASNFPNSATFWGVMIVPQPGREWVDVLGEFLGPTVADPARALTYSAAQMLERVDSGEFTRAFLSEMSIRHRIRRFGYGGFDEIKKELEIKRGLKLEIVRKDDTDAKRRRSLLKFRVVARATVPPPLCPQAPNPVFRYSGEPAGVHLAFKRFLQRQLLELKPSGNETQRLWAFDSWKSYWRCFPDRGEGQGKYPNGLGDLIRGCVVHPDVKLIGNLGHHDFVWTVDCSVGRPWTEVLPEIHASLAQPDAINGYGLSAEAANLLRWVLEQPKTARLLGCSPLVEEAIRKNEVRLGAEWPSENLPVLVDLLCEEVSRRTPFNLKPIPWKTGFSGMDTRVRITEGRAPGGDVTDAVMRWLDEKGVARTRDEVQQSLEKLLHARGDAAVTPS